MFHSLETLIQNEFLPERELKNGAKGVVSLLREKKTGKRYVCRRYHGSGEAYEALQGVDCPNLPRVEKAASRDGIVLVLEEYIQGDTLDFLLEECPLGDAQAREILIQVCRGLKVLHSLGVVHRDVKPENIILRGDEAVLIDFDVSRVCKPEQNSDTQVMGTTGYAAPEQFGFSQTDARADIFSLGVLLNEMLIRRHPSQKLADGPLRPIIEKCIEVNVDKRYTSVDELLTALDKKLPAKKKLRAWWLAPAVLLVAVAVLVTTQLLPIPESMDDEPVQTAGTAQHTEKMPMPSVEPSPGAPDQAAPPLEPTPSADEPSQTMLLQCRTVRWHSDTGAYGTEFQYDLDGDGVNEFYLFAAMFNFVDKPRMLQDSGSTINDKPEVLEVVPAVWMVPPSGGYQQVEEFATLLTDCVVTVRQIEGEQPGKVEQIGSLYGIWPGAIRATFDSVGLWHYECSARLNGETLTAVGTTRTELLEEDAPVTTRPPRAPLFAMKQTDGVPVGEAIELKFGIRNDLKEGTCEVYSYTAQHLDNGHIRFALDFLAPKVQSITIFDPPDGARFMYGDHNGTSGERALLVFDMSEEQLQEAGSMTITFDCGDIGRFLISVNAKDFL